MRTGWWALAISVAFTAVCGFVQFDPSLKLAVGALTGAMLLAALLMLLMKPFEVVDLDRKLLESNYYSLAPALTAFQVVWMLSAGMSQVAAMRIVTVVVTAAIVAYKRREYGRERLH